MTGPVRLEHAKLVAVLQQQAAHRLHQLVLVPRLIVLPALPWILPGVRTTLAFVAFVALPLPFGWQWFLEPILLHRCCRFRKCDPKELSDLFVHITMSIIMTMLMMVMMVMVMMVVVVVIITTYLYHRRRHGCHQQHHDRHIRQQQQQHHHHLKQTHLQQ